MRCSAKATGHQFDTGRPLVDDGGGERLVGAEPHQREQRQLERLRLRRRRPRLIVGRHRGDGGMPRVARAASVPMAAAASFAPICPSASAARPRTSGAASVSAWVSAAAAAASPIRPERERRHLPDVGVGVGEQPGERLRRRPADRPGRSPARRGGGCVLRASASSAIEIGCRAAAPARPAACGPCATGGGTGAGGGGSSRRSADPRAGGSTPSSASNGTTGATGAGGALAQPAKHSDGGEQRQGISGERIRTSS